MIATKSHRKAGRSAIWGWAAAIDQLALCRILGGRLGASAQATPSVSASPRRASGGPSLPSFPSSRCGSASLRASSPRRTSLDNRFYPVAPHPGSPTEISHTLLFLVAYLLYNDGIQTVIALASQFGAQELGMETSRTGAVDPHGAICRLLRRLRLWLSRPLDWFQRAIMLSLVIWLGVTVYTYAFLQTVSPILHFGGVIAIVLGGSQALSRSLFSLMIPQGQEAEYFSSTR